HQPGRSPSHRATPAPKYWCSAPSRIACSRAPKPAPTMWWSLSKARQCPPSSAENPKSAVCGSTRVSFALLRSRATTRSLPRGRSTSSRIMPAGSRHTEAMEPAEIAKFKEALIRLKQRERLYIQSDFGVAFIGRSLFRATIELPPNVPVGPLVARVYLFKDGRLLGQYKSRVMLERQGLERYIHDTAIGRPLLYGIATVLLAAAAGLTAAFAFRRIA